MRSVIRWACAALISVSVFIGVAPLAFADSMTGMDIDYDDEGSLSQITPPVVVFDAAHRHIFMIGRTHPDEQDTGNLGLSVFDETGQTVARLFPQQRVRGVALSPDGTTVAVSYLGVIQLLDAATLQPRRTLQLPDIAPYSMAWAGGSLWFQSGQGMNNGPVDAGKTAELGHVDLTSSQVSVEQERFGVDSPLSLASVPGAPNLLVVGENGYDGWGFGHGLSIRDVTNGQDVVVAETKQRVDSLDVSPDGRHLAVGDGTDQLRVYSLPDLKPTSTSSVPGSHLVAYSPDGRTIASVKSSSRWDVPTTDVVYTDVASGQQTSSTPIDHDVALGLGYGSAGQPLTVLSTLYGGVSLGSFGAPATVPVRLTEATHDHSVTLGQPVLVGAYVAPANTNQDYGPLTVHVDRYGPDGHVRLPDGTSSTAPGSYGYVGVHDLPVLPGFYRYRLSYDGAPGRAPASLSVESEVREPTRSVTLPFVGFMHLDPLLHRLVFATSDGLAAVDESGVVLAQNHNAPGITDFAVSPDGLTIYTVSRCTNAVQAYDALTLAPLRSVRTSGVVSPSSIAFAGTSLWVAYNGGNDLTCQPYPVGNSGLARLDPTGVQEATLFPTPPEWHFTNARIAGNPALPNRLAVTDGSGTEQLDISSGAPAGWPVRHPVLGSGGPITLLPDGRMLVGNILYGPDLTVLAEYGDWAMSSIDPSGRRLALIRNLFQDTLSIRTTDGTSLRTADAGYGFQQALFSADGNTVYTVLYGHVAQTSELRFVDALVPAVVDVIGAPLRAPGAPVSFTGTVRRAAEAVGLPGDVQVVRNDANGVATLAPVKPDATGRFTVTDSPTGPGPWTYQLRYAGDGSDGAGGQTVVVAGAPGVPRAVATKSATNGFSVSWQPPASDGGSAVTGYRVTVDGQPKADLPAATTLFTAAGLIAGSSHTVTVRALNAAGAGDVATLTAVTAPPPSPVPTPSPSPTPKPTSTPTPAPVRHVSITGPATRPTTYGATVTVAGTADPGATVGIWFRQGSSASFVQRRTLTASSTGAWSTTYVANDDYSVYATNGVVQSPTVLVQVAPTITGALTRTVRKNTNSTVTGTGIPGSVLTLHFHRAGSAATDFSILRTVVVAADGSWSRTYLADVDYRFYATEPNRLASPTVLAQAR